jgi:hypothetical protein
MYRDILDSENVGEQERFSEWVEATHLADALRKFFRDHSRDGRVLWLDDDERAYPVEGRKYLLNMQYIWIEDQKLMEYEGIQRASRYRSTCPLCDGDGQVDSELADEFYDIWIPAHEEPESGADTDVSG